MRIGRTAARGGRGNAARILIAVVIVAFALIAGYDPAQMLA